MHNDCYSWLVLNVIKVLSMHVHGQCSLSPNYLCDNYVLLKNDMSDLVHGYCMHIHVSGKELLVILIFLTDSIYDIDSDTAVTYPPISQQILVDSEVKTLPQAEENYMQCVLKGMKMMQYSTL